MILVLDNYDSFTYNLVQYLGELGVDLQVRRNDEITIDQIRVLKPERILVSPGPCSPREAGLSNDVIRTFMEEGIPGTEARSVISASVTRSARKSS